MKLYQALEQTFKMRISSNSEIISYIKKLSEMGKLDEPKKIAAIALLLDRVGQLEDAADIEKSLSETVTPETADQSTLLAETLSSPSKDFVATPETVDLTCQTCGKVCASEFGLKAHQRSHNNTTSDITTP